MYRRYSEEGVAKVTLSTAQIKSLYDQRVLIIPAAGANTYILVNDIMTTKTGLSGVPSSARSADIALAFVSETGGHLPYGDSGDTVNNRAILLQPAYMSLKPGSHARHIEPGRVFAGEGTDYAMFKDTSLVICVVGFENTWALATNGLTDISLTSSRAAMSVAQARERHCLFTQISTKDISRKTPESLSEKEL